MKSATAIKKAWMTALLPLILLAALPGKSAAQFVQHATTTTENFHYMVYDKSVEGRIYGAISPQDPFDYPRLFMSDDAGETWHLLFEFTDPYRMPGDAVWGRIMDIKTVENSDWVYFTMVKTSSPYTDGVYGVNCKTLESKHYLAPNVEMGAAIRETGGYDVHGTDGQTVFLHTTYFGAVVGVISTELYYTTDGGENWDMVYSYADHDYVHVSNVAIDPADPDKLYILRSNGPSGANGGLLISEDAGKTWTEHLPGTNWNAIAFNPSNPDKILIGSTVAAYIHHQQRFMRSLDGGDTWTEILLEYSDYVMNHFTDIEYDPHDPNRIIAIEENQIFLTDDGFQTYQNLMPAGYEFGLYASINPFNTDEMFIGIDGNSVKHTLDRCQSWETVNASPTSHKASHAGFGGPDNQSLFLVINGQLELATGDTSMLFSLEDAMLEKVFPDRNNASRALLSDTGNNLYFFDSQNETVFTPIDIPANAKDEIRQAVADPDDAGLYWIAIGNGLYSLDMDSGKPSLAKQTTSSADPIYDLLVFKDGNNKIMYVAQGSNLYKSTDEGQTWEEKAVDYLGIGPIDAIAYNPMNVDQIWVSQDNMLYLSPDAGESLTGLAASAPVKTIACSPYTNGLVVAGIYHENGHSAGILVSDDAGNSWQRISGDALKGCHVQSMAILFDADGQATVHMASPDMGHCSYAIETECHESEISRYPWREGFEEGRIPPCWSQEAAQSPMWVCGRSTDGTPGTTADGSQSKLLYMGSADENSHARLITPLFSRLDSVAHPLLSFDYTLSGHDGSLSVYYRESGGEWTKLPGSLAVAPDWNKAQIHLPTGIKACQIGIEAVSTGEVQMQIDNIGLQASKGTECAEARDLTAGVGIGHITLEWTAPIGNYNATYNLYRGDSLIAGNIPNTSYKDSTVSPGSHLYTLKTLCNESETQGTSTEISYTEGTNPVRNLEVSISNAINGDIIASLAWDLPESYAEGVYNIYRDNELIAENITVARYTDRDFITDGEHEWSVSAVYGKEESEKVSEKVSCANRCAPIRDLDIAYDVAQTKVSLEWGKPGALPEEWLTYSYEPTTSIGFEEPGGYTLYAAIRYTPEQLAEAGLDSARITHIAFVPKCEKAEYIPTIWMGGDGTTNGSQMTNEIRLGSDLTLNEWNSVELTRPVTIDATQELWIGIEVSYAGGSEILGCDAGPGYTDRNMVSTDINGEWLSLDEALDGVDCNLSIAGKITLRDGRTKNVKAGTEENISYNIYRDGELIGTTAQTSFSESGIPESIYTYSVTAVHNNGCESEPVAIDFFAGNTCPAIENLEAENPETEVVLQWEAAAPYLKADTLLYEDFDGPVPEDWSNLDKDGDGHIWKRSDEAYIMYPCTPYEGAGCIFSESRYNYQDGSGYDVLAVDNWLITPPVKLTHGNARLTYHIGDLYKYSFQTYYEVLISTTGTDYEDFSVIDSDTLPQTSSDVWYDKEIDLSSYSGVVYVAFRHHNDSLHTTMGLQLDEVAIVEQVPIARKYNVYRNSEKIAGPVEETSYTDQNVPAGTHEYCVRAICDELGHESNPVCANVSVNVGNENRTRSNVKAYPNPTNGQVSITSPSGIEHVAVFTMSGQKIIDSGCGGKTAWTLDLSAYPDGIYLLDVDGERIKITKH